MFASNFARPPAIVWVILAQVLCCTGLANSEDRSAPTILGRERAEAVRDSIVGTWTCQIGQVRKIVRFSSGENFEFGNQRGRYRIEGATLVLQTDGEEVAYAFTLEPKKLTFSGADLAAPLVLTKVSGLRESGRWLWSWSPSEVKGKLRRIAVIAVVVVVSQIAVRLFRGLVHRVVYSEYGPLKFIYRRHKKRTMTIYSLVLNLSKYVVYLVAIGLILTELGVNYTVYFASLSVIGLAIGFGSQGLVQDMVTGFFIVFEEQFNVGDIVEVPPHTGIVEELGLRMTRLRNVVGQRVVIPNRNIAAVGNYVLGAQQVYLDVALSRDTDMDEAAKRIVHIAGEIARQFPQLLHAALEREQAISLATGERFVRLHVSIWPQQQWVVDQELLPRMRAVMKSEGFQIPGDKITVFHRPPELLREGQ